MSAKFLCKICNNPVAKNHIAAECDNCGLFISNAIKLTLKLTNTSKKKAVPGIIFLA